METEDELTMDSPNAESVCPSLLLKSETNVSGLETVKRGEKGRGGSDREGGWRE